MRHTTGFFRVVVLPHKCGAPVALERRIYAAAMKIIVSPNSCMLVPDNRDGNCGIETLPARGSDQKTALSLEFVGKSTARRRHYFPETSRQVTSPLALRP
jgi:hypothetical protein